MNPDLSKKALNMIEAVCEQGCSQVNQLLEMAKNGQEIEELSEFSRSEITLIIDELAKIMAVYDADNNTDNGEINIK